MGTPRGAPCPIPYTVSVSSLYPPCKAIVSKPVFLVMGIVEEYDRDHPAAAAVGVGFFLVNNVRDAVDRRYDDAMRWKDFMGFLFKGVGALWL